MLARVMGPSRGSAGDRIGTALRAQEIADTSGGRADLRDSRERYRLGKP